jgi:rhamnulokinase
MQERAFDRMPKEEFYETSGIQFMPINTLYQLLAMEGSPLLQAAQTLLLISDLISYWLTGEKACEFTAASTTQLCDARSGGWARDLLEKMRSPSHIFGEIVPPGTQLGPPAARGRRGFRIHLERPLVPGRRETAETRHSARGHAG